MAKPTNLTDEQRNEIVERYKAGETQRSIANAFGVSQATVKYHIHRNLLPTAEVAPPVPVPQGLVDSRMTGFSNESWAFVAFGHCEILGWNSPETVAFCRSHGVTPGELRLFGDYYNEHCVVIQRDVLTSLKHQLADSKQEVLKAHQVIAQQRAQSQKDSEALAAYGRKVLLQDKELTQRDLELQLLKKLQAILGSNEGA